MHTNIDIWNTDILIYLMFQLNNEFIDFNSFLFINVKKLPLNAL